MGVRVSIAFSLCRAASTSTGVEALCRISAEHSLMSSAAAKAFERLPTLAAVTSSVGGAGQVPASRFWMSSRAFIDLTGCTMNEGRPERMAHTRWLAARHTRGVRREAWVR